jgi:hypothetical protein
MPKTKLTDTAYDSAVEIAPGIFWVGFYDAPFESLLAFGNNTAPKDDISLLGIQLKNSLAGS